MKNILNLIAVMVLCLGASSDIIASHNGRAQGSDRELRPRTTMRITQIQGLPNAYVTQKRTHAKKKHSKTMTSPLRVQKKMPETKKGLTIYAARKEEKVKRRKAFAALEVRRQSLIRALDVDLNVLNNQETYKERVTLLHTDMPKLIEKIRYDIWCNRDVEMRFNVIVTQVEKAFPGSKDQFYKQLWSVNNSSMSKALSSLQSLPHGS
ncbi:MAG: hypothetical protein K2X98_04430 [Alphaproteobacteria bacterium]|nr:hypothetical protein [Alphaproteobacteria bacterium]